MPLTYDERTTIARKASVAIVIVLFVASVIEGSVTGWLVHNYNKQDDYPSSSIKTRIRYLVFASWWSVLWTIVYGVMLITPWAWSVANVVIQSILLFMTWAFWLGGAAALTQAMRAHHTYWGNTVHNAALSAAEGFAWLGWILATFDLIVILFSAGDAQRNGDHLLGHHTHKEAVHSTHSSPTPAMRERSRENSV
ncbi:hypothetical protein Q8F55_005203 [Vanrija albida]|uniref:MARVEL domain-containing protein n=1 Tax=Vanrija albida TaxID=181172 RepID=A0ABR3Q1M2_9TREE